MKQAELWDGKVSFVPPEEQEPFDDMAVGDVIRLGPSHSPRRVLNVRRSPKDDAVRVIHVERVGPGNGPVVLWRADLKLRDATYSFRGYESRA